jgi:hypothetical protein
LAEKENHMTTHKNDIHEDSEAPRRGPGRPPKVHEAEAKEVKVTYHPLENGDPVEINWDGETFKAGEAKAVKRRDLIAMAKNNPWFEVEGHPRAQRFKPTAEPVPPAGADADPIAHDDRKMVEGD